MFSIQVVVQIILMFFVLVTIHEWGHYYFAQRAGILVREFAIGFGPKLFSYKKGETRFTLRLLPIGGFVRMAGEDPEIVHVNPGQTIAIGLNEAGEVSRIYLDQLDLRTHVIRGTVISIDLEKYLHIEMETDGLTDRYVVNPQALMIVRGKENQIAPLNRQFGSKTVMQRAISIFAGPVMNLLLAFVLFVTVVFMAGIALNVKIASIAEGSPAEAAGIASGDVIIEINGETIGGNTARLQELIQGSPNVQMSWLVERDGASIPIKVTPREENQSGLVGIVLTSGERRSATVFEAVGGGWSSTIFVTDKILEGFKKLVLGQFVFDDLGGPVRIVEVTGEQVRAGMVQYIWWTGILSLYLCIFNLLPIPALDGSRLVFLAIEAIRGKPVDPNRESMVHFIGFAMLMLLMVAVTYNDILRLITG